MVRGEEGDRGAETGDDTEDDGVRVSGPVGVVPVAAAFPTHPSSVERRYGVPLNVPSQEGIKGSSYAQVRAPRTIDLGEMNQVAPAGLSPVRLPAPGGLNRLCTRWCCNHRQPFTAPVLSPIPGRSHP